MSHGKLWGTLGAVVIAAVATTLVARGSAASQYTPQTRNLVLATVPLVTHEHQAMQAELREVFGPNGALSGKEIFGFYPDTIVVYQGDTVNLTLVNAQPDDAQTFTIQAPYNINVSLRANSSTQTSFVANQVGIFPYMSTVPDYSPYTYGTLVVLPASSAVASPQ
jgi:FtsP/CotA-like multicopper oxidase with cupredoxin domain